MSFHIPRLFQKEDQLRKQLKKVNLYTDDLINCQQVISQGMQIFKQYQKQEHEQQAIKSLVKLMQQKTTYGRKLKLLLLIVQITKQTKYDIADILISKKLKLFTKSIQNTKGVQKLTKHNFEQQIHSELLLPLYNYMMKLSVNQELFNTCKKKQIPQDQIFRRGIKIRFIWMFKLYNLIHALLPILQSLIRFIQFSKTGFFKQMVLFLYNDLTIMNQFILKAIEQAAQDNYILMPYFDMLQFYQSLTQQLQTNKKILTIYQTFANLIPQLKSPKQLTLSKQDIQQIELQALRVKLISNTLKNPKKDHTRLQTQYNVKSQFRQKVYKQKASLTEGNQLQEEQDINSIKEKFMNLDIKKELHHSLEQVSDQDQNSLTSQSQNYSPNKNQTNQT